MGMWKGALIQCSWEKREIWTQIRTGRIPHEDEGREWGNAYTSQGALKVGRQQQE